ncbi:MAG: response regulator [Kofleriaceae bacterium]|nr:response regulator [Kofleriaceae bacterium]
MKRKLSLKRRMGYALLVLGALTVLSFLSLLRVQRALEGVSEANRSRYEAYLLADELRQSSDDLTRLARTYVVSGEPSYERQYFEILAIRNGDRPRPLDPERIYWDFVAAGVDIPEPSGRVVALLSLMRESGFTQGELGKLAEATEHSDALVTAETIAMNATKGQFLDERGQFSKVGEPDFELARTLTHDEAYHKAKGAIMGPINEFFVMLDKRTGRAVTKAKGNATQSHLLAVVTLLLTFSTCAFTLSVVYRGIRSQLGGEPEFIGSTLERIANQERGIDYRLEENDETSVLATMKGMSDSLDETLVQLRQSRDTAESTSRMKSEFIANMSHEIRTPMNGLLGMIEMLADTELDSKQAKLLSIAGSSGQSLLALLNNILDISKIEAGMLVVEEVDFCLLQSLEEVAHLSDQLASQKRIVLRVEHDVDEDLYLRGDIFRIKQVVGNFVSNAVKFTSEGEVVIRLSSELVDADTYRIKIGVTDSGIGISREALQHLFQDFSQADSSTTRRFGGTGLGLSISKKLVKAMNGEIFVESEEGVGSTFGFTLVLPKGKDSRPIEPVEESVALTTESSEQGKRKHRILLVEDNKVNQILAKMMLAKLGYDSELAVNGREAVDAVLAATEPYTLVLMDLQMPVMGGLTATAEIRERLGTKAPPIVAMTANAFDEDRAQCRAVGMVDFVAKPVSLATLQKVLQTSYVDEQEARTVIS